MIQDWLNSPDMQETIGLMLTPHFLFFFIVSVAFILSVFRMLRRKSVVVQQLSDEDLHEFQAKFVKRKDRANMPTKFDEYADEVDRSLRTLYRWMALQFFSVLVLWYKLLEVYAL